MQLRTNLTPTFEVSILSYMCSVRYISLLVFSDFGHILDDVISILRKMMLDNSATNISNTLNYEVNYRVVQCAKSLKVHGLWSLSHLSHHKRAPHQKF